MPLVSALLLLQAMSGDLPSELKRFTEVFAAVEKYAADPVSSNQAIYGGAIPGMLRQLDPHSVFFDPAQFQQLKQLETSTRKGFGTVVSVLPGRVIVLQAVAGTPSAKAGMTPGDEIVAVNGIPLNRLDMEQIIGLLTQAREHEVRLDLRRAGRAGLQRVVMTPEEMQSPSVDRAFALAPGIGYLRVTSFDANTGTLVKEGIEKIGGGSLKGLVLDLRDNPGGLLPAALETASLFLKPGSTILSVRGRTVQGKEEKVPEDAHPYSFPLAVLINGKSASASEIVAGALQDHDRAVIVGSPSFGKGLVESVYPLPEDTGLALTTAYYYTPSGRSIQRPISGSQIHPTSLAAQAGKEFRTASGRKVRGGGGIQPDEEVYPEPYTRFRAVMEGTGAFTSFATEYLREHSPLPKNFDVTPELLDRFRVYLSERNIMPDVAEWSSEREWIRNRLKAEIVNQAFGVERGDEIEAQRDPVILAALRRLESR